MIDLQNISFSYDGSTQALNNVSLRIAQGEFVCIAGGNGSGKSTLARHMNALLAPTKGTARILGLNPSNSEDVFDIRKAVAMVFQNPDDALVASIVEDEVSFGPANLGIKPTELRRRVTDSLNAVGLKGFEKREVHTLSGGQKQRLAIAGALAMAPEVLILDEATSMLDPEGQSSILAIAQALNKHGMTVIMITHSMEEALAANRLVIMREGAIVADGSPDTILTNKALVEEAGLAQPSVMQLSSLLRARGLNVPATCSESVLKEALCKLR